MSGQKRSQHQPQSGGDDSGPAPAVSAAAQSRNADVDALLDEIDDVLETNAESFVRGFVQKGGQ